MIIKKILILILLVVGLKSFSQNKVARATIEVDGVCMMCKSRIEKACLSAKGVKYANWDVNTHQLKLIYNNKKIDLDSISNRVAKAGHDTKTVIATPEDYATVHPCCMYRDDVIKETHKEAK